MKPVALGFRMHSGWGVLVAVTRDGESVEIVARERIIVADKKTPGAVQPYHHAARLGAREAESHIANCAAVSGCLAGAAIGQVVENLKRHEYRVVKSAVLLASGRSLPPLAKILVAHPLIHTAEGEFFRNIVKHACERLKIPVESTRERDLEDRAEEALGKSAGALQQRISDAGKSIGPPWTKDHKTAALAAFIALSQTPNRSGHREL